MARSLRLARVLSNTRNVGLSVSSSRSHFLAYNTVGATDKRFRATPSISLAKHFSAAAQPEGESESMAGLRFLTINSQITNITYQELYI